MSRRFFRDTLFMLQSVFKSRRDRTAAMPFVMLTVLIDLVSIGLIIPVLPSLVGHFTHSHTEQVFWYGAVICAFAVANFFGSPILGRLSDSYGRRPVLLIGFCGLGLNFFATALAPSLWVLVAVRFIGGMMQANMAVTTAYVADITPPEARARRFGMLGAMFGLGFIIGPVMGGLLGAINLRLPFFAAGSLAMLNLAYGILVLPESLPPASRRPFSWRAANPLSALGVLTEMGEVRPLLLAIACSSLAQFVMFSIWVLYTGLRFDWGPLQNGWSLAASGLVSVLVQGVLLGRLLRRFSPTRLALSGMLSAGLAYLLWGLATQGWMMYAVIGVNLLGPVVSVCIQSIISGQASASDQGSTLGAVNAINSLSAVLGPILATPLLGVVSNLSHQDWRIGLPFFFCALLQAVALLLALTHFRRHRRRSIAPATAP
jgi:MFS transporter, DHA1 family, tetracycline resistance protein